MKTVKVVTIGGGSSYTPELVEGMILRSKELPISEWWFVDIPEGQEKLEIVVALAQRMVTKAGLDWTIKATLDRQEALRDADFVTSQFRVGGLGARYLDETIPLSHGNQTEALLQEMLMAHRDYLPQFAASISRLDAE